MEVFLVTRNYTITVEKIFKKSHAPFSFKQKFELSEIDLFDSNQLSQNFIWKT